MNGEWEQENLIDELVDDILFDRVVLFSLALFQILCPRGVVL